MTRYLVKLLVGDGGEAARQELDDMTPILYGLEGLPLAVSGVACFGEEMRLAKFFPFVLKCMRKGHK